MKRYLIFFGLLFLGISMIISSYFLSQAIKEQTQLNGIFNGSLSMDDNSENNDILRIYDVAAMFAYEDYDSLIKDIKSGRIEGIPYTKIGENYIFSKKALEEWVYNTVSK